MPDCRYVLSMDSSRTSITLPLDRAFMAVIHREILNGIEAGKWRSRLHFAREAFGSTKDVNAKLSMLLRGRPSAGIVPVLALEDASAMAMDAESL